MNAMGSFLPLLANGSEAASVLFVFAADTPTQRRAIHEEALYRLDAATALSEVLTTTRIEAHGSLSHVPLMDAVGILMRDARGLLSAMDADEDDA